MHHSFGKHGFHGFSKPHSPICIKVSKGGCDFEMCSYGLGRLCISTIADYYNMYYPNLVSFLFKENPFASNLQIHLAFCVNNIRDSCSLKNCCCSFQGFVLQIWRWNTPHLSIYCSISAVTAAPSMWRELADGQRQAAGNKFSAYNFWKSVIPQMEFEVLFCSKKKKVVIIIIFLHRKLQTYKEKRVHFLFSTGKVIWSTNPLPFLKL